MRGTALIWAARKEYKEVVKILLEYKRVKPDKAERAYSWTPLSWVARSRQCSQWGSQSALFSGHFWTLPEKYESKTRTDSILPSRLTFSKTCPRLHPSSHPLRHGFSDYSLIFGTYNFILQSSPMSCRYRARGKGRKGEEEVYSSSFIHYGGSLRHI